MNGNRQTVPSPPRQMLATYLHDLDPVALRLTDALALRWYGLSYVVGYALVFIIMRHLSRRGLCEIRPEQMVSFVVLGAFFTVVFGGHLGYLLLYDRHDLSLAQLLQPHRGGMSAHGGIASIVIYCWAYARWKGISWLNVIDAVSCSAPLGVFFGRIANFVNGELFGRVTSVPWAVKFPTELLHDDFLRQGGQAVALPPGARFSPEIIAFFERETGGREKLAALLHPRHPSQIYEALGEGLLLFALLYFIRVRFPRLPHGMLTGLFFLLYAVARIAVESLRQPDSGSQPILGLTQGQFYSLFMIGIGLALLIHAWKKKNFIVSGNN